MVFKLTQPLRAPAGSTAEAAAIGQEEADPSAMGSWLQSITPEMEQVAPDPQGKNAPKKKEDTDGKPADKRGGDAKPDVAAAPKPGADAGNAPAATGTAAAGTKPADTGEKPGDKPAEAQAGAKKDAPKEEEAPEKWPRTSSDWDKWKAGRKEEREKLQAEIKDRETKLQAVQAKVTELEKSKSSEPTAEHTTKIESLTAKVKDLTERLMVLDVTQHPDFQNYFSGKVGAQLNAAKGILGEEKFKAFETALKLPDREMRDAELEQIVDDLGTIAKSRIGSVLNNLDAIDHERSSEIKKAEDLKTTLSEKRTQAANQAAAAREKTFTDALAGMQDEKLGMAIFQYRKDDSAWNTGVDARIEKAKDYLSGKGFKPLDIAKAALYAAAMPDVLEAYSADMAEKDGAIEKLTAQVKGLSAAQPGGGGGAGNPPGQDPQKPKLKAEATPFERAADFAKQFGVGMNAE